MGVWVGGWVCGWGSNPVQDTGSKMKSRAFILSLFWPCDESNLMIFNTRRGCPVLRQCKLDPGLKVPGFKGSTHNEDKNFFQLEPGF